jgi:hypothetical protein
MGPLVFERWLKASEDIFIVDSEKVVKGEG